MYILNKLLYLADKLKKRLTNYFIILKYKIKEKERDYMTDEKNVDIDSYYIVKGRFRGTNTNTYGVFIIFINIAQKMLENVFVAASHFSSIYDNSPEMRWDTFEEKITTMKWKGELSTNISHDLELLMGNALKPDSIEEIIDAIKINDTGKIEHFLMGIVSKGLMDKSTDVEVKVEKVSHSDIIKAKDERARREKEEREAKQREELRKAEEERFKVEEGAVILDISPVIAPVSGIPIYEAQPGDAIMVKIDASTDRGNYFIDLLNARSTEGDVLPVKAIIKDVFMNALGEYELLTEIGPGIYGRTIIEEKIKIKKYDISDERINLNNNTPTVKPQKEENITPVVKNKSNNNFFIWIVGGITFLLAILILYLLISGLI